LLPDAARVVVLAALAHLGEETPPVEQARRTMQLHAQVIVAMMNEITTARAMAPWVFPMTLYRMMRNQLGCHLAYLQLMPGQDVLLLNANRFLM
jgi:hypothetical protein